MSIPSSGEKPGLHPASGIPNRTAKREKFQVQIEVLSREIGRLKSSGSRLSSLRFVSFGLSCWGFSSIGKCHSAPRKSPCRPWGFSRSSSLPRRILEKKRHPGE